MKRTDPSFGRVNAALRYGIFLLNGLKSAKGIWSLATLCLLLTGISVACERDTRLTIKGGNPPTFVMSGSGSLGTFRVRGPKKQREAEGEDASIYWQIKTKEDYGRYIEDLGPITYGIVPKGYVQVYPEKGEAPQLVEGESYYVQALMVDANGTAKHFAISNGKAVEEDNK
jgi:hypothetical protein